MSTRDAPALRARLSAWRPIVALQTVAFWSSILLPIAFVPLLYGGVGGRQLLVFVGLVALNVVCFAVGHGHSPRD